MPFHTLLKVAAVVNGGDPQTRQRLDHIAVERLQIEVNDRFDRDVSEDAAVGASIAATDGTRREQTRQPAPGVSALGIRTPLGAIVDTPLIADVAVLGLSGETDVI
jgi:ornithine decarboxylase